MGVKLFLWPRKDVRRHQGSCFLLASIEYNERKDEHISPTAWGVSDVDKEDITHCIGRSNADVEDS